MKTKKIITVFSISFILTASLFVPMLSFAQGVTGDSPIGGGTTIGGEGTFGWDPNPVGSGSGSGDVPYTGGEDISTTSIQDYGRGEYTGYCSPMPSAPFKDIPEILRYVTCVLVRSIVPLLFAVALAVFIWGMVKFISANESAEKEEGRQFMLWGVIALAVMLSVWGLVKILNSTFGIETVIPQVPVNKPIQGK